ncbi:DUF4153 domain-containing protein [Patescibacteria group bacterium]|nr:DUF4153 domain-containing protein [Patescibacteria group bacterium]
MKKTIQLLIWAALIGTAVGFGEYNFLHDPRPELNIDGTLLVAIAFTGLAVFILTAYRKVKNIPLLTASLLFFFGFLTWSNFLDRGTAYSDSMLVTFVALVPLLIGFFTIGVSEKELKQAPDAFNLYIRKLSEVLIAFAVFIFALTVSAALFTGLLYVTGVQIPPHIIEPLVITGYCSVALISLALSYNFEKPLTKQAEFLSAQKILSYISSIFLTLYAAFLLVYIIALVPQHFAKVLSTGHTVPLFLGLSAGIFILTFFTTNLLPNIKNAKFQKALSMVQCTAFLEVFVLDIVALSAINQRIGQYGFTYERFLVIFAIFFSLALLLAYLQNFFFNKKPSEYLANYKKINLGAATLLLLVAITLNIFNFEQIALKSHINRIASYESDLEYKIDKLWVNSLGPKSPQTLLKLYEQSSPKMRLDIALTMPDTYIDDLKALETDQNILDFLSTVPTAKQDFAFCEAQVNKVVEGNAKKFCSNYTY